MIDLAAYLEGAWSVERTIRAGDGSPSAGAFSGVATFTAAGDLLRHQERGTLRWGSHHGPAERAWLLAPTDDPGVREVTFADGRPFHRLDLRTGEWTAVHRCGQDTYAGAFAIESIDQWTYEWTITGPDKALRLTTGLSRAQDGARDG